MLLAVDKPRWISSFDIIRALRRDLWEKKIWHSGTLDPMATGLLLLWTGLDTKKIWQFIWLEKSYETTIDFSKKSDTRDMFYRDYFEEIDTKWMDISIEDIKAKLNFIVPETELPLPTFSAKRKGWKQLYKLARAGKEITENKLMKTYEYEILDYQFPTIQLKLHVWSWTYIRSIWHRLWEQFWLWWILTELRRISIWEYSLEKIKLDKSATFYKKDWNNIDFSFWIIE